MDAVTRSAAAPAAAGSAAASGPSRRLYRRAEEGLLAGVAQGIAEHLGVRPSIIRISFVVLTTAGGLGLVLYGAYWIVLPTPPGAGRGRWPGWVEYAVAAVGAVAAVFTVAHTLPLGGLFLPILLACFGGALIWRQASETERERLRTLSRTSLLAPGAQ